MPVYAIITILRLGPRSVSEPVFVFCAPCATRGALARTHNPARKQKTVYTVTQEKVLANSHKEFLETQRRREEELQAETVPTDWCYGPQKLNYVELKKAREEDVRYARSRRAVETHGRGEAAYRTMPPER